MGRLRHEYELGEILHLAKIGNPVGVTVVFGGQAGSEGKGKIAGWLAKRYDWEVAASTFMPNAGHTFVEDDGSEVVVTQLPVGLVSDRVRMLVLGATSVINVEQLFRELTAFNHTYDVIKRLAIHPRAQVMLPGYVEWEAENLAYIASTGKGCGAAIAAKARREQGVILAKDHPELKQFVRPDMDIMLNDIVNRGGAILTEQSQGFDLDINHGHSYPFCTSRQCTPSQICADLALDARLVTNSIAVVRSHPIRVGNVDGGTSGEYGSREIDWNQVSASAGRNVLERTTVTDRVRRVFEFDFDRISVMSRVCRPTTVALTFADYLDEDVYGLTQERYAVEFKYGMFEHFPDVDAFIQQVTKALRRATYNVPISLVSTGPMDCQTVLYKGLSL
jgi:adenylosuccinate synthase